ncbi:MAG: 3-dehydroquinate synthase, partial [Thermoanaerobaculia bacterium]
MERRRRPLVRHAPPVHQPRPARPRQARERPRRGARARLRRGAQRRRARRRFDPYPRSALAVAGLPAARHRGGGGARPIRIPARRAALRRAAARRPGARPRPHGDDDGRGHLAARRHRLPQDRFGDLPDDRGAVDGRRAPARRAVAGDPAALSFAAAFELRAGGGATRHRIGGDALAAAAAELATEVAGRTVFLVTEATVWGLHGERLAALPAACSRLHRLVVPAGEAAKQVEVADSLWRAMSAAGGKRDSRVIAFGGGSVGDLAGFVAGTFLRGVDWLLLPTTLLAQVDASIGGKTAVDLPEAKNAVGLFHHPRLVVADTGVLATLPPEQVRSGLVEAVKVAALLDPELLARIERDRAALLAGDAAALAPVVATAARLKAGLVER